MALSKQQTHQVANVLRTSLRNKIQNYQPETNHMPFHTRLLGKDRLTLFSFIHSLNTNFGTAIFEPVAIALASPRFKRIESQSSVGNQISEKAHTEIQNIMDSLTTAETEPDKPKEIDRIRRVCQSGAMSHVKLTKIDLLLEAMSGEWFLFDLKTVKPNVGNFKEFKRTLLEWAAAALAQNPKIKITTAIAIPYNPYYPKPYNRWTMRGMLDLKHELYVAEEFWDFLGGKGAFDELLDIFEQVGVELRPEIDVAFAKFKT
jgi:type II restriction enzyme